VTIDGLDNPAISEICIGWRDAMSTARECNAGKVGDTRIVTVRRRRFAALHARALVSSVHDFAVHVAKL